jgi:hypothetical protein
MNDLITDEKQNYGKDMEIEEENILEDENNPDYEG